jgi:hypothetical protein
LAIIGSLIGEPDIEILIVLPTPIFNKGYKPIDDLMMASVGNPASLTPR